MDAPATVAEVCGTCGAAVRAEAVRAAFWQGDRLVVVEGVPARVCTGCGEQSFDDRISVVLDLLRGEGFPQAKASGELRVPVFAFADQVKQEPP